MKVNVQQQEEMDGRVSNGVPQRGEVKGRRRNKRHRIGRVCGSPAERDRASALIRPSASLSLCSSTVAASCPAKNTFRSVRKIREGYSTYACRWSCACAHDSSEGVEAIFRQPYRRNERRGFAVGRRQNQSAERRIRAERIEDRRQPTGGRVSGGGRL